MMAGSGGVQIAMLALLYQMLLWFVQRTSETSIISELVVFRGVSGDDTSSTYLSTTQFNNLCKDFFFVLYWTSRSTLYFLWLILFQCMCLLKNQIMPPVKQYPFKLSLCTTNLMKLLILWKPYDHLLIIATCLVRHYYKSHSAEGLAPVVFIRYCVLLA